MLYVTVVDGVRVVVTMVVVVDPALFTASWTDKNVTPSHNATARDASTTHRVRGQPC